MKARAETIARRLAQALLDAALDCPAGPEPVRQQLAESRRILTQCAEARPYLEHPLVPSEAKESVLAAIAPDTPGGAVVRNLLRILGSRQALRLLPAIEASFVALWDARRGVVAAEAVSASPMTPEVIDQLRHALELSSRRGVELTTRVAPELIGGVVVRFAGRVLDGSVRGRLQALRERLRQAATY